MDTKIRKLEALKSQGVPIFLSGTLKGLAPGSMGSMTLAAFTQGCRGKIFQKKRQKGKQFDKNSSKIDHLVI